MVVPCPYCHREIPLSLYAKHFAAEGGRVGGRSRSAAKRRGCEYSFVAPPFGLLTRSPTCQLIRFP